MHCAQGYYTAMHHQINIYKSLKLNYKISEMKYCEVLDSVPLLRLYFADVKMNHVRGAVSIRNMAQGSDPACVGKKHLMSIFK